MSYAPFRDNPDLAGLPDNTYEHLAPLADRIEDSHAEGLHDDLCGCTSPACSRRIDIRAWPRPSTEEVLGWLIAHGLLNLDAATAAGAGQG